MTSSHNARLAQLFELWPAEGLGPAFLTSYNFDPTFFENVLVRELVRRGAFPLVIFVDRRVGYEASFTCATRLRGPNCEYHLVPFEAGQAIFHPKVHLFADVNAALVGSGNLTPGGAGRNLEMFDCLDPALDGGAVASVRDFFRGLLKDKRSLLSESQRADLLARLPASRDPKRTGDAVFLHSLDAPLRQQLRPFALEGDRVSRFFSPFYDQDHRTAKQLGGELGAKHVEIAAASTADQPPLKSKSYRTGLVDEALAGTRYLHAKVLHARGKETSTLVVGSANLTHSAWDGKNVEAVVVRQGFKPDEFREVLDAVGFTPAEWCGERAVDLTEVTTPSASKRLELFGAELSSSVLRIFIGTMPPAVRYTLENAGQRTSLAVEIRSGGVAVTSLKEVPKRAFVVCASARGFEDTRVWVHRPDWTASSPRMRAVTAALEAGTSADAAVRRDVLSCVLDLFARLHAHSTRTQHGENPTPASTGDTGNTSSGQDPGVPSGGPWMERVDEIILGRPLSQGGFGGSAPSIMRALSIALGLSAADSDEVSEDEGDFEDAAERDPADGNSQNPSAAAHDGKSKQDETEFAREAVEKVTETLRDIVGSKRDDALVVYDVLLKLLEGLAASSSDRDFREEVLRERLRVINEAFGTMPWPATAAGWATSGGRVPDEVASLRSLLEAARALRDDFSAHDCDELDDAHRCLSAMMHRGGLAADAIQGAIGRAGFNLLSENGRSTAEALLARDPVSEQARRTLSPLWRFDGAFKAAKLVDEARALAREELAACEAALTKHSHRSATHKAAAARIPSLRTRFEQLNSQYSLAVTELAQAREELRLAPNPPRQPTNLRTWLEHAHERKPGKNHVFSLQGGACGNCHVQIAAAERALLADPRNTQFCRHCGVLLAVGPRRSE